MTIPYRGATGDGTYFITASTWEEKCILQSQRTAELLIDVLFRYRKQSKYLLHEFVVMPNHFHLLITPLVPVTIERAVQFIKGGFSYRAKKELSIAGEIWQTSFYDHRVRNDNEYVRFRQYIHMNPVKRGSAPAPGQFPYSSVPLNLDDSVAKAISVREPQCRAEALLHPSCSIRTRQIGTRHGYGWAHCFWWSRPLGLP
jgi:putative transposase